MYACIFLCVSDSKYFNADYYPDSVDDVALDKERLKVESREIVLNYQHDLLDNFQTNEYQDNNSSNDYQSTIGPINQSTEKLGAKKILIGAPEMSFDSTVSDMMTFLQSAPENYGQSSLMLLPEVGHQDPGSAELVDNEVGHQDPVSAELADPKVTHQDPISVELVDPALNLTEDITDADASIQPRADHQQQPTEQRPNQDSQDPTTRTYIYLH